MRLIDADELILHLNDFMLQQSPIDIQDIESIKVSEVIKDCIKAVDEQPTAYNVENVVEELGEIKVIGTYPYDVVKEAIEIVKGGGIDGR